MDRLTEKLYKPLVVRLKRRSPNFKLLRSLCLWTAIVSLIGCCALLSGVLNFSIDWSARHYLPVAQRGIETPKDQPENAEVVSDILATTRSLDESRSSDLWFPTDKASLPTDAIPAITDVTGVYGPIPKIADNGMRPLDAYSSPASLPAEGSPRISIIVKGMGLSQMGTQQALELLSPNTTLAFVPGTRNLKFLARKARQMGYEIVLQVPIHANPIEKYGGTEDKPSGSLNTFLPSSYNIDRLHWMLAQWPICVGIISDTEDHLSPSELAIEPVIKEVSDRGLTFLADWPVQRKDLETSHEAFSKVDLVIDESFEEIDARLAQLEDIAKKRGIAIGAITAFPTSIKKIAEWSTKLRNRGISLVPVSSSIRWRVAKSQRTRWEQVTFDETSGSAVAENLLETSGAR